MAAAPCDAIMMLIQTLSLTPQLFELTLRRDSTAITIRQLLSAPGIATFPGIGGSERSGIAVFTYKSDSAASVRSAAMTLHACSA